MNIALAALAMLTPSMCEPAESELTFRGAGSFELKGTLLVPAHDASTKCAAVLLLPGSGPPDRNGNIPPLLITDLLKQMAEHLLGHGIASFRFDKRSAAVYANSWPKTKDAAVLSKFFSWANFVGDARAAYQLLQSQDGIDPKKTFFVGHSEGGLITLQVAHDAASSKVPLPGIALLATAGRRIDTVIREQISASLERSGVDQKTRDEYMAATQRAIDKIKAEEKVPTDLPAGLVGVFNPTAASILRSYFTLDPIELASKFQGPVLIVQGEADIQVSLVRDAERLATVFRERKDNPPVFVRVPKASHNFKVVGSKTDPGFQGPVAKELLEALTTWVKAR